MLGGCDGDTTVWEAVAWSAWELATQQPRPTTGMGDVRLVQKTRSKRCPSGHSCRPRTATPRNQACGVPVGVRAHRAAKFPAPRVSLFEMHIDKLDALGRNIREESGSLGSPGNPATPGAPKNGGGAHGDATYVHKLL